MLSDQLIMLAMFVASGLVAGGAWLAPRNRTSHDLVALGACMSLAFPIGGYLLVFHIYTLGGLGVLLFCAGPQAGISLRSRSCDPVWCGDGRKGAAS